MRKENSLFNKVVDYVNSIPTGETYKVADMLDATSPEARNIKKTWWNRDPFYRNRSYQSMLKRCGFIRNVKRGEWQVIYHIPAWFTVRDAQILIGWVGSQVERTDLQDTLEAHRLLNNSTTGWGSFADATANLHLLEGYNSLVKEIDQHKSQEAKAKKKKKQKSSQIHTMKAVKKKANKQIDRMAEKLNAIEDHLAMSMQYLEEIREYIMSSKK